MQPKVEKAKQSVDHPKPTAVFRITDGTRLRQHPNTYSGIEQALVTTAACYRKALWDSLDVYVEIWCEKDALSGVIYPITSQFDVSLMVSRGYSSLSFLASAAEEIIEIGKPTYTSKTSHAPLKRRMLAAKERSLAKIPGLIRIGLASSAKVTSRTSCNRAAVPKSEERRNEVA